MQNKAVTTVNTLLYKHFAYQERVLEDNTNTESIKQSYDRWGHMCKITAITPTYIRIELPDKAVPSELVSYYNDYKIHKGLWIAFSDYDKDIDEFYWCRYKVQTLVKKWLCSFRCSGPYLSHIIDLR